MAKREIEADECNERIIANGIKANKFFWEAMAVLCTFVLGIFSVALILSIRPDAIGLAAGIMLFIFLYMAAEFIAEIFIIYR